MKTMEEILIRRGELERIYTGATALHLWRGIKQDGGTRSILHPVLERTKIGRARFKEPDVRPYEKDGQRWVRSEVGRGVSLLDRPNAFSGRDWEYFLIPAGTEIPFGLLITKDHYIDRLEATHYSICPNHDMPVARYLALLDALAINARRRQTEIANG